MHHNVFQKVSDKLEMFYSILTRVHKSFGKESYAQRNISVVLVN